jgi:hypothetical protein
VSRNDKNIFKWFFFLRIVIENRDDYRNSNIYDTIDSKNITINEDAQKRSPSRKACFCVAFLKNKCFVLPFVLLFILVLTLMGMLIFVLIEGNNRINNLKDNLRIKENFIAEAENQSNQTMEQLNKRLLEQQEINEQSNKRLLKQQEITEQLNKNITELKKQNNQKIKQLNDRLLQNNATIEHLNKTFIECKTKSRR